MTWSNIGLLLLVVIVAAIAGSLAGTTAYVALHKAECQEVCEIGVY